jgi:hypothetical protein
VFQTVGGTHNFPGVNAARADDTPGVILQGGDPVQLAIDQMSVHPTASGADAAHTDDGFSLGVPCAWLSLAQSFCVQWGSSLDGFLAVVWRL